MLFKIGRKLSSSGAISSVYEIYYPPIIIKILFFVIGFSFGNKNNNNSLSAGAKLCNALQEMGTTFIKLGQFLATRPDIIGDNISKDLEKLQDKLPPFSLSEAKNIIKNEIGIIFFVIKAETNYKKKYFDCDWGIINFINR